MATNPNFKFRRGLGFSKACLWLLSLWLVALIWSLILSHPPKNNFAILVSSWCLMAFYFLQQKTLVSARFADPKSLDTLILDQHQIPTVWSQFVWCRKNTPTLLGGYRTSLVAYQHIENQKVENLTLLFEQGLNSKNRGLFLHLPLAPHFDESKTFAYKAIGQSLFNVVNITDPAFLDDVLLNDNSDQTII